LRKPPAQERRRYTVGKKQGARADAAIKPLGEQLKLAEDEKSPNGTIKKTEL